ncbi:MAG: hypothetical protein ABW166_10265 [Sedimenticola sp.]
MNRYCTLTAASLLLCVLKRCHCTHLKVIRLHWVIEKSPNQLSNCILEQ